MTLKFNNNADVVVIHISNGFSKLKMYVEIRILEINFDLNYYISDN